MFSKLDFVVNLFYCIVLYCIVLYCVVVVLLLCCIVIVLYCYCIVLLLCCIVIVLYLKCTLLRHKRLSGTRYIYTVGFCFSLSPFFSFLSKATDCI